MNAVREVYEHVYETVDVQGNPEIRASATAKVRFQEKYLNGLENIVLSFIKLFSRLFVKINVKTSFRHLL